MSHNGSTYCVSEIYRMAFLQCTTLVSVTIPGSVTSIGLRAFANDTSLTSVSLQEGVERIDMMAFAGCTALSTISLPSTLSRIAASAFEGTAYYNDPSHWNSHYTLTLDHWVLMEGNYFEDTVYIVEGIVGLANNSFLNCNKIPKVVLPSTLKYMGDATFRECASLDTVQMNCTTPPTISTSTFEGLTSVVIQVPCGALDNYIAAAIWNDMPLEEMICDTTTPSQPDTIVPINPWPGHPVIGIDEVECQPLSVSLSNGGIVVSGAEGQSLYVYDMIGHRVAYIECALPLQHMPLPSSGLYVLLTESGSAIKISYCR